MLRAASPARPTNADSRLRLTPARRSIWMAHRSTRATKSQPMVSRTRIMNYSTGRWRAISKWSRRGCVKSIKPSARCRRRTSPRMTPLMILLWPPRWLSAAPSILLIVPWPRKRKVDDAPAVQAGKAVELLYASSGLLSSHAHSADRTSSRIGPALLLHGAGSRATEPQAWVQ